MNAGHWLDDSIGPGATLRADSPTRNRWMIRALSSYPWTALNLAHGDLPGLDLIPREQLDLPIVSANVTAVAGAPAPEPWLVIDTGGTVVGITGLTVSPHPFLPTDGYTVEAPLEAADATLTTHGEEVDLAVLLAFEASEAARRLALAHPSLAVVVDAGGHRSLSSPFKVGDATWVRSSYETRRLGELRLWLRNGHVIRALDRQISMNDAVEDDPELARLAAMARRELEALETMIFR